MFIGFCAGNFYALNKTRGEVQWSYDISKDGKQQSFHGDPLVIGDLILIGTDRSCDPESVGHVYALERGSGNVRWKYGSTSVATDIIQVGSNVLFGSFQDQWSSVDLRRGTNQPAVIVDGEVAENFERSSRTKCQNFADSIDYPSFAVSARRSIPTGEILRLPTRYWRTERHRMPNSVHLGTASLLQPLLPPCTEHCICPHQSRGKACFRLQQRL